MKSERTGAETLRLIVQNLNVTSETFNDRYSLPELIAIGAALLASEWDIYPYQWTEAQVRAAIKYGEAPRFDDNEKPLRPYTKAEREERARKAKREARVKKEADRMSAGMAARARGL